MISAAIYVELVQILDDGLQRVRRVCVANFPHHTADHLLIPKLSRVEISAIAFKDRPDFLNHITRFTLGKRMEALERFDIRTVPRLKGLFNVPLGDRRVVLTNTCELERLTISRNDAIPDQFQEVRFMRKDYHLSAGIGAFYYLVDSMIAAEAIHTREGIVE